MAWNEFDVCNDGGGHQWTPDPGSPDGMVCGGCGVSEAELDHLTRQRKRAALRDSETDPHV